MACSYLCMYRLVLESTVFYIVLLQFNCMNLNLTCWDAGLSAAWLIVNCPLPSGNKTSCSLTFNCMNTPVVNMRYILTNYKIHSIHINPSFLRLSQCRCCIWVKRGIKESIMWLRSTPMNTALKCWVSLRAWNYLTSWMSIII